jgi:hypothetical protein
VINCDDQGPFVVAAWINSGRTHPAWPGDKPPAVTFVAVYDANVLYPSTLARTRQIPRTVVSDSMVTSHEQLIPATNLENALKDRHVVAQPPRKAVCPQIKALFRQQSRFRHPDVVWQVVFTCARLIRLLLGRGLTSRLGASAL